YFVNVQPIDVCPTIIPLASASSGCAPVGAAGSSQFGFVDSNGIDITRAILNQASIDVNFQPLGFIDDSRFLNLNLMTGTGTTLESVDFRNLSDQAQPNAIHNGVPPSPPPPP